MDLVLVPGFMTDAVLWDDVVDPFRALGPITYGDVSQDASIADMAQRVLAEAPARFALIGFSMGGYVAREIVRIAPGRVQALVLVATSARADTAAQARRKAAAVENVGRSGFTGLSRSVVISSLHPDRADDAAMIERIRQMGDRLGGKVFVRQAEQVRESDLGRLGEIRCPTLIVAAAQDALRSLDEARELHEGILGSVLRVVEGSGHMVPIEAPAALAHAVVPWLRTIA
jgi:pimeloyl-ACP methyl ester carboxylesterase